MTAPPFFLKSELYKKNSEINGLNLRWETYSIKPLKDSKMQEFSKNKGYGRRRFQICELHVGLWLNVVLQ